MDAVKKQLLILASVAIFLVILAWILAAYTVLLGGVLCFMAAAVFCVMAWKMAKHKIGLY